MPLSIGVLKVKEVWLALAARLSPPLFCRTRPVAVRAGVVPPMVEVVGGGWLPPVLCTPPMLPPPHAEKDSAVPIRTDSASKRNFIHPPVRIPHVGAKCTRTHELVQ